MFSPRLLVSLSFLLPTVVVQASVVAQAATDEIASQKTVVLKVGDPAPEFSGKDDRAKPWDSKMFVGKKILVVYFYPADLTPGCTKQACSYRDAKETWKTLDVEVIGISGDSVENHRHFKQEHKLNFTLLADPNGKIAKLFGVKTSPGGSIVRTIGGKDLTLTRGVTARRWTFVIDRQGRIAHIDDQVKATKDSELVLKVISGTSGSQVVFAFLN